MIGDERKTWEEIVRHARVNSGCAIQEGFVPDDGDKAILAADAELTALWLRCERLEKVAEGLTKARDLARIIEKSDDVIGRCGCRYSYDKIPADKRKFPDDVCMSCKGMYIRQWIDAALDAGKEGK